MKRFTLIIDGHNFFFRSLWSCFSQGAKRKLLTTEKDMDSYEKKLMLDFCSIIKQVKPIAVLIEDYGQIAIICDYDPWTNAGLGIQVIPELSVSDRAAFC